MIRIRRALSIAAVVTLFLLTLLMNWPVGTLLVALSSRLPSEISVAPAHGTLLSGSIAELGIVPSQGWPIGLGPLRWEWMWPTSVRMTLGDRPSWQLTGKWRGLDSHWRLTGGSLDAFTFQQWPVSLAGTWQGQLEAEFSGTRCEAARGSLASEDLRLLTPAPIDIGIGHLNLGCDKRGAPQLSLALEDDPGLDLTGTFVLAPSGTRGHLRGILDASHPLADWWRLVDREENLPTIDRSFGR